MWCSASSSLMKPTGLSARNSRTRIMIVTCISTHHTLAADGEQSGFS
jgi:hypothetical protein